MEGIHAILLWFQRNELLCSLNVDALDVNQRYPVSIPLRDRPLLVCGVNTPVGCKHSLCALFQTCDSLATFLSKLLPSPTGTYYLGIGALKKPLRPYYLGTRGARAYSEMRFESTMRLSTNRVLEENLALILTKALVCSHPAIR